MTDSRHRRHFLTRGAHPEQQVTWPHGWNNISLFASEQTRHSSMADEILLFGLTWVLISISPLCFSLWHLVRVLHKLGSGQRSRGVCPFLFLMVRSAPFPARKQAMLAEDFLSEPWVPRPMRSLPTSCTSWSWRSWERVWWRRASWRGVSPSLSGMFRLADSRTSNWKLKVKFWKIRSGAVSMIQI